MTRELLDTDLGFLRAVGEFVIAGTRHELTHRALFARLAPPPPPSDRAAAERLYWASSDDRRLPKTWFAEKIIAALHEVLGME